MKPNALVFFDLDGTLLNKESRVETEVVEALEQMKQKGNIPFIATGRSPIEIQHVLKETPIDSFITLNGQYIVYEGQEVYRNRIPVETLVNLKQATEERKFALSFYTNNKIRATRETEILKEAYQFIHAEVPSVHSTLHLEEEVLMALILNTDKEQDAYFKMNFPELSFYRNTPYSMDIIPKGNSKATGITELVKTLNFETIPTFAFGDGSNDIEMVEHVDYGVAMGNGLASLKEKAAYITASHVDGGIIEGLKYYDLI